MQDAIIIGGGPAGLINAIGLSSAGFRVLLFEQKKYPFHRVCGEYISNEVRPFLESLDCYPGALNPMQIRRLQISSISGKEVVNPLDIGGFGISRYRFDHWLAKVACEKGVELQEHTKISSVKYDGSLFQVKDTAGNEYESRLVIAAIGKRSTLDRDLKRRFLKKRSPFVGVKYHVRTEFPDDLIALHNFREGYCGIVKVEENTFNVCYLVSRAQLRKHKTIDAVESNVLRENPHLDRLFTNADHLFKDPVVVNEVSFTKKEPVWNHMIMCGDTAGMIAPLCGNGMALAIQSAQISILLSIEYLKGKAGLYTLGRNYSKEWNKRFSKRLWIGRFYQNRFFGSTLPSSMGVSLLRNKWIAAKLIRLSHGSPIDLLQ